MGQEREFQRFALSSWGKAGGWAENVHPNSGMTTGIPDTLFFVDGCLLPVEMKIGHVKEPNLVVEDIRPAQRRWHMKFNQAGGQSVILVGEPRPDSWGIYELSVTQFFSCSHTFPLAEVVKHDSILSAIKRQRKRLVLQVS
jgi:hypothetical protein